MLSGHESRSDVLSAERAHRFVREEVTPAGGDPTAFGAPRSHAGYLRDVADARPKGRTKIATETKTLKVGDPAPDFTLRAHDGRTIALSALRGQRVVIAFMAFAFSGT
jgi:AhpC/TSA family